MYCALQVMDVTLMTFIRHVVSNIFPCVPSLLQIVINEVIRVILLLKTDNPGGKGDPSTAAGKRGRRTGMDSSVSNDSYVYVLNSHSDKERSTLLHSDWWSLPAQW